MLDVTQISLGGETRNIRDNEARRRLQVANRLYVGQDLTVKHAVEISSFASPWDWIQARIKAGNFTDINVEDFIPLTITGGIVFMMEVAGINTYRRYGDVEIGNHIDFISRDCHPDTMRFNPVNYNNGTTVDATPWLASELYHRLNSLSGSVPSATTVGGGATLTAVNFATTGVLDKLPASLRNVIVQKRVLLPTRNSTTLLLIDDNSWVWKDAGLLWIPSEMEVYGANMWGSLVPATPGHSTAGFVQYPIFANNMKRVKGAGHNGGRATWWLSAARGGGSTRFALVGSHGDANSYSATTAHRAPLCFRIA